MAGPSDSFSIECAQLLTDRRRGARDTTLTQTASHAARPIAAAGPGCRTIGDRVQAGGPDKFYAADTTCDTAIVINAGPRTISRKWSRRQEVRQCQVAGSVQGAQQEDHRQEAGCQKDWWYVMTCYCLLLQLLQPPSTEGAVPCGSIELTAVPLHYRPIRHSGQHHLQTTRHDLARGRERHPRPRPHDPRRRPGLRQILPRSRATSGQAVHWRRFQQRGYIAIPSQ